MARPLWLVKLIKLAFPYRSVGARLTRVPLLGKGLEAWLFGDDRLLYLPLERTIHVHEAIPAPENLVLPSQVVDYFIRQANHHWIMNRCICRDAGHCEDYPIDLGCLFLGEAALGINPALGRPVSREEALDHARRCREAGLVHLIGRNKLDTVWLGIGPGSKLLTLCSCCPCCCLWRVLPQVAPSIAARTTKMPGVNVTVTDRCLGCGTCTRGACFVDAIHLDGDHAHIGDACRGCGRCADVCPQGAIEVSVDGGHYIGESIRELSPLVDLS